MFIYLLPLLLLLLGCLLRLAVKLRLTLPIIYALLITTAFHDFYITHTALADNIFFLLIATSVCSWLITISRAIYNSIAEQKAALELIRQASARGEYKVHL
mgnify:CR=1 FL=1